MSFLFVPCPFGTWAVIAFHNFLSYVAHINVYPLLSLQNPILLFIYTSSLSRLLAITLYSSSVCHANIKLSNPSFLIIPPIHFNYFQFKVQVSFSIKLPHCSHIPSMLFSTPFYIVCLKFLLHL